MSELFSNIAYDLKYSWIARWNRMKAASFGCGRISPVFFQNLKALKCLNVWIKNVSFQFSQKKTCNFELSSHVRIGIQIHANWVSICVHNFQFIKSPWHCSLNNVHHKRIYTFFSCSSFHVVKPSTVSTPVSSVYIFTNTDRTIQNTHYYYLFLTSFEWWMMNDKREIIMSWKHFCTLHKTGNFMK